MVIWRHNPGYGWTLRFRWPIAGYADDWVVEVVEVYGRCQCAGEKVQTLDPLLINRLGGEPGSPLPPS